MFGASKKSAADEGRLPPRGSAGRFEILRHYDGINDRLGDEFWDELNAFINLAAANPRRFQFAHHGKQYEIRCTFDGYTAHVRAFQDDRPANGFVYSVDLPVALDFKQWTGIAAIEPLVESAKNDIVNCSWEKIRGSLAKAGTNSSLLDELLSRIQRNSITQPRVASARLRWASARRVALNPSGKLRKKASNLRFICYNPPRHEHSHSTQDHFQPSLKVQRRRRLPHHNEAKAGYVRYQNPRATARQAI